MQATSNDIIFGRCRIILPWPDWESSTHDEESQIPRQGRAMTYPFSFIINKNAKTARFSSTSELPYYDTTLSVCDCFDFQERGLPCKHIYRLAVELGVIEIVNRASKEFFNQRVEEAKTAKDMDSHPDQLRRQVSASHIKCAPVEIDYQNKTAVFAGSGKKPYEVTVNSCTCRDYFVRRLPCKHIYRLRFELENAEEMEGG